jgi:hypothetical protein
MIFLSLLGGCFTVCWSIALRTFCPIVIYYYIRKLSIVLVFPLEIVSLFQITSIHTRYHGESSIGLRRKARN